MTRWLLAQLGEVMQIASLNWTELDGWRAALPAAAAQDLVLYFGSRDALSDAQRHLELRRMFPDACLLGCSTGGQIGDEADGENNINAIALRFDATTIRAVTEKIRYSGDSYAKGEAIGRALASDDLAGVFVLSDGLMVNGSELIDGIGRHVGHRPICGGLAGDGAQFAETLVGLNCTPQPGTVAAIGFYGSAIKIGYGSAGGWSVFGPKRRITHAEGNVLFQLEGKPALDLYERYLGEEESKALPGSALLFPLQIHDPDRPDHRVVRTVLAIDRARKSMTFAGDLPEGWVAQLMYGNFDRLADGAKDAANQAREGLKEFKDADGLAILVSCIGRKLLMGQRISDEVEAVGEALGPRMTRIGFYSYGEITPHATSGICELHNQMMTITTIAEAVGAS